MTLATERRAFSVSEYARMRETGILGEDDRVELLDGEIYQMSPLGPLQIALVNRLNRLLVQQIGNDAIVSVQGAIQLDDYSEPQPDIAVLHPRDDFYAHALARPEEILFLVEVADSSLAYDREQKLPRYAQASISEVWIIDVNQRVVEHYTHPLQGQYTHIVKILYRGSVQSSVVQQVSVTTDQIFG
jgi:Uma2 family endonuclease